MSERIVRTLSQKVESKNVTILNIAWDGAAAPFEPGGS
jgi:hypothetical protein